MALRSKNNVAHARKIPKDLRFSATLKSMRNGGTGPPCFAMLRRLRKIPSKKHPMPPTMKAGATIYVRIPIYGLACLEVVSSTTSSRKEKSPPSVSTRPKRLSQFRIKEG
jgi:hypothetical protein